jgi:hypothetical protein
MARTKIFQPTQEDNELLRRIGSGDMEVSIAAAKELAVALQTPLRQGLMSGDILNGIFEPISITDGSPEFPLDFLAPGTERDFVAYTMPNHGRIPQRHIEGDYVMVPTYDIANSIDWLLKYARKARWDIVGKALQVLQDGFVKKMNDDGWQVLISAAIDRNIVVLDSDAAAGQFTKRLVSLAKTVMRRNGGGNSTSQNRGMLTDMYMSPEGMEDIRNWNVDQVDETTRREIFLAEDGAINRIFGVNLHDLDEFGEGQEYQNFFDSETGVDLPSGDLEFAVGLDQRANDSFVMPVDNPIEIHEDPYLHRELRAGYYGFGSAGFGALDNRRILALSF